MTCLLAHLQLGGGYVTGGLSAERPANSSYYQYVQDPFEAFEQVYEERFERQYGFLRHYITHVIYRNLDCGGLHKGFTRVRCWDCGHDYLLSFSCKRRQFLPPCHPADQIQQKE